MARIYAIGGGKGGSGKTFLAANLGTLFAERGDLRGALALFRRAVELRPQAAKARVNLAHVLVMQGRREEAIALYSSAVELDPELDEAREGLRRVQE